MPPPKFNTILFLKILLHAGFFVSGMATVLIGQVLPILAAQFALDDARSGIFFPTQLTGSLIGTFLTNRLGKRNKFLFASLTGCFLMGAGVLMLNFSVYELCLVGFFVNGIGIGLTLPSINMLILELSPERAAAALSVLNFFWGLGAIICSLTVLNLSKTVGYLPVSAALAALLLAVGALLMLIPSEIEKKPEGGDGDGNDFSTPIWSRPLAWLIAGFNFIHVGFESAMGGWLPTYTERLGGQDFAWWAAPTFLYFVFFVVGRGIAPLFFRFLSENKMLFLGLLTILAGLTIISFAQNVGALGVGASVAGFGTSWVFPTNMSRFTKIFGASASRRMMPFFICGTFGAAFTTWFVGYVSSQFENDLRWGIFVLPVGIFVLIVLQIYLASRRL